MLKLLQRGLGWSVQPSVPLMVDSLYKRQQGLVVAGNRVFFGDGLGLQCVEIVQEQV